MRILLGLTEVSGFFSRLQSGFSQLGIEAVHVSLQTHRFAYAEEASQPLLARCARWAVTHRLASMQTSRWLGILWLPAVITTRLILFIWAALRFDVFIMGAGSSFFGMRELPLLRFLGKTVIYTLHGTDARPPYIDGFFDPVHYGLHTPPLPTDTAEDPRRRADRLAEAHAVATMRRLKLVQQAEHHANFVLCAPSYAQFLSKPFVNFYAIGLPTALPPDFQFPPPRVESGSIRVLHAPSHATGKGTAQIRGIIAGLQKQGLPIEYVEVSGRPNAEVLQEIAQSDLVVDQFYGDTPMAGFPAEAGMLGKPAAVGGYFAAKAREEITPAHTPPSAYCLPENLGDTIARLTRNSDERHRLGAEAGAFVNQRWTPACVAGRFLRLLQNDLPQDWIIDPNRLSYVQGIGLSESQARANIAALIENHGVKALGLAHKPLLQERFVKFSRECQT